LCFGPSLLLLAVSCKLLPQMVEHVVQDDRMEMILQPIGVFHCDRDDKYAVPHQPGLTPGMTGTVVLEAGRNLDQALEGLEEQERLWLIFAFHQSSGWKPKIMPPRGDKKLGLFSTRSPHRPNALGMSCVRLLGIDGLTLSIADHDLLDGTPILDIKPYLPYADAYPTASIGPLGQPLSYTVDFSNFARRQLEWLAEEGGLSLDKRILPRLSFNPFPHPSHRIRIIGAKEGVPLYELANKTWRILYTIDEAAYLVTVQEIRSGYDEATLAGQKTSRWDDVALHQAFVAAALVPHPLNSDIWERVKAPAVERSQVTQY